MIVGITGLIGSGKSTVAKIMASYGFKIIDADKIAYDVVKDEKVLRKLCRRFGDKIMTSNGHLKRKYLAKLAFASDESRKKLNNVIHPPVRKEIYDRVKKYRKAGKDIILDVPLLIESELLQIVDFVILVHASEKIRFIRLIRKGLKRSDIIARQKRQLPYSLQREKSDFVIINHHDEDSLRKRITNILKKIRA